MSATNKAVQKKTPIFTHEGAPAMHINAVQQLRRTLMTCMLWEDGFYEDGQTVASRIQDLVAKIKPEVVMNMAIEAREKMKLRHAPLLVVREMARLPTHKALVSKALEAVIQRPDELTEFLAIYWKEGKQPLSAQVKKGLAKAYRKFDEYSLQKYNRDNAVKLRDVLRLVHVKPSTKEQGELWGRVIKDELATPNTWEVQLSANGNNKETWSKLLADKALGGMALLRNLRNMIQAGVDEKLVFGALETMKTDRILPFRFISAAKHAVKWEDKIEPIMLQCIATKQKLAGKTVLLVDNSGSMTQKVSGKSDISSFDAGCALAILLREICDDVEVYTFNQGIKQIAPRRGFALRDAMGMPSGGTNCGAAVRKASGVAGINRMIVITDEQSADHVDQPNGYKGYMINVAHNRNGVGYGKWTNISGWSESVVDFITEVERQELQGSNKDN